MLSLEVLIGRCEVYQKVFSGSCFQNWRSLYLFFFFFLYSSAALNKSGSYEDYEVESELRNDFILIIVSNMSNKIFEVFVTEICLVGNVKIKRIFTQHRNGEMRRTHQGLGSCGKKALKDDSDLTFLQLLATRIVLSQM